jgi:hypothetical protein
MVMWEMLEQQPVEEGMKEILSKSDSMIEAVSKGLSIFFLNVSSLFTIS